MGPYSIFQHGTITILNPLGWSHPACILTARARCRAKKIAQVKNMQLRLVVYNFAHFRWLSFSRPTLDMLCTKDACEADPAKNLVLSKTYHVGFILCAKPFMFPIHSVSQIQNQQRTCRPTTCWNDEKNEHSFSDSMIWGSLHIGYPKLGFFFRTKMCLKEF